jgi:CheY-like chemotaxis protein
MRLYLRLALEGAGAEVMEAGNLQQARRCLRDGPRPTSVLLDLELPDGSGLDLLREVPSDVPVVALTADDSRETQLRCREAGCAALVCKGERLTHLWRVLDEIESDGCGGYFAPAQDPVLTRRYTSYLAESRLDLERVRALSDFDSVRRIAHRLRGTAVHFGYPGIGASARLVGVALASGRAEQISAALDVLGEQLLDAVEAQWLDGLSTNGP